MSARCSLLGQRAVGRRRVENRCRPGWWRLSACEGAWFTIDGQLRRVARAPQCPSVDAVADTNAPTLPPVHPRLALLRPVARVRSVSGVHEAATRECGPFNDSGIGRGW